MNLKSYLVISLLIIVLLIPITNDQYYLYLMTQFFLWSVFALFWDMLINAGIFSFGQLAFFGIGGYTMAMLWRFVGVSPWIGIFAGAFAAVAMGFVMGLATLRLKSIYVCLLTLAAQEVVRICILNFRDYTGGNFGLHDIPPLMIGSFSFNLFNRIPYYYLIFFLLAVSIIVLAKMKKSPLGLAFAALRDSEVQAKSSGIRTFRYRIIAFVISAFFTGMVGALSTSYFQLVSPDILSLGQLTLLLSMIVIGGTGTIAGPVIGTGVILFLTEIWRGLEIFRFMVLGLLIIAVVVYRPTGLLGIIGELVKRARYIARTRIKKVVNSASDKKE